MPVETDAVTIAELRRSIGPGWSGLRGGDRDQKRDLRDRSPDLGRLGFVPPVRASARRASRRRGRRLGRRQCCLRPLLLRRRGRELRLRRRDRPRPGRRPAPARRTGRLHRSRRYLDDRNRNVPRERGQRPPARASRLRDRRPTEAARRARRRVARRAPARAAQRVSTDGLRTARILVAEAIGTSPLVFAGAGAVMVDANWCARPGRHRHHLRPRDHGHDLRRWAHLGRALQRGGHLRLRADARHFPWPRALGYWTAQLTGAILAAFLLRALLGDIADVGATLPPAPRRSRSSSSSS